MITDERIEELVAAATVGAVMSAAEPSTVVVRTDELLELIEELRRLRPVFEAATEVIQWDDEGPIGLVNAKMQTFMDVVADNLPHPEPFELDEDHYLACETCGEVPKKGELVRLYPDDIIIHDRDCGPADGGRGEDPVQRDERRATGPVDR